MKWIFSLLLFVTLLTSCSSGIEGTIEERPVKDNKVYVNNDFQTAEPGAVNYYLINTSSSKKQKFTIRLTGTYSIEGGEIHEYSTDIFKILEPGEDELIGPSIYSEYVRNPYSNIQEFRREVSYELVGAREVNE